MIDLELAHKYCTNNKEILKGNKVCGCFYCKKIFKSDEIKDYIDDANDTALCPYCGIDSIIGECEDIKITNEFLELMHNRWFEK